MLRRTFAALLLLASFAELTTVMRLADRAAHRLTNLKPGHAAMWPHWQPVEPQFREGGLFRPFPIC